MSKFDILKYLKTDYLGREIVYVDITDSTNSLAKRESNKKDGTIFVANMQTAGRGRNGKSWISKSDEGLWFSILLKPQKNVSELSGLTIAVGLAVLNAINKLAGVKAMIKWPNDIVLDGKKLCGVLCESVIHDGICECLVCGIGINILSESFDEQISSVATSLKISTGKEFSREEICAEILNELEILYFEYLKNGLGNLIANYKENCITLGKGIVLISDEGKKDALAVDVGDDGELIVIINGEKKHISSGEVSVRGIMGYV